MTYLIRPRASYKIRQFYLNVAKKFKNDYSLDLLNKNIDDALNAIYQIENGIPRREPILTRWKGLYMASYMVNGKTRWNYAYRIEDDIVYIEDACHAQNMHGLPPSSKFSTFSVKTKYRRLTKKPLFGYPFVMNAKKEYNLIDNNGRLITQWFKAIKPFQKPYGKYQIIAYINVGGWLCALGYDGKVYNLNRTWSEAYMEENAQILNSDSFKKLITESIDVNNRQRTIQLTETQFKQMLVECITKIIKEIA